MSQVGPYDRETYRQLHFSKRFIDNDRRRLVEQNG